MENKRQDVEQGFYEECAKILATSYEYKKFPYRKKTRWNNRAPGNGRFPGFGLIRMFSPSLIQVSLVNPATNKTFYSMQDVYDFLASNALDEAETSGWSGSIQAGFDSQGRDQS